jgi:hypothetical protein
VSRLRVQDVSSASSRAPVVRWHLLVEGHLEKLKMALSHIRPSLTPTDI